MTANELRIKNLVLYDSNDWISKDDIAYFKDMKPHEIRSVNFENVGLFDIDDKGLIVSDISEIEPIPLTEEWLVKFGFIEKFGLYESTDNGLTIQYNSVGGVWIEDEPEKQIYVNDIIYVHQLQNLYFVLIGKELIHNETTINEQEKLKGDN